MESQNIGMDSRVISGQTILRNKVGIQFFIVKNKEYIMLILMTLPIGPLHPSKARIHCSTTLLQNLSATPQRPRHTEYFHLNVIV